MSQLKWDKRFARLAKNEVALWSKDPDEKVGCVIVSPDRRRMTMGYNGFPKGIADTDERLKNKELKNLFSVHAELNAILNSRTDLTDWTLYVTKAPCTNCAWAIIQAGISRVVMEFIKKESRWCENQTEAMRCLQEAGVAVCGLDFDNLEEDSKCDFPS